jgi:hypothetical protein
MKKSFSEIVNEKFNEILWKLPEDITEMDIYLMRSEPFVVGDCTNYGIFCHGRTEKKGPFVEEYDIFGSKSYKIAEAVAQRLQDFYKNNFNLEIRMQKGKDFEDREDFPEEEPE